MAFAVPIKIHATGFSQWLVTNFSERRIHSASVEANRLEFRQLKLALDFFVIGLKPVAWFVFDWVIKCGLKPVA
jgi:hypothetical protein